MAFDVYPNPASPTTPLNVAASTTSPATTLVNELHGPFDIGGGFLQDSMLIRAVEIGACAAPGGPDPSFILQSDSGAEVTLTGTTQPIFNALVSGTHVADARVLAESNRVFFIQVFLLQAGSTWKIKIQNNDAVAHDYTWVVAESDAETQQPWMDAPLTLDFDTLGDILVDDVVTHTLTVPNKGTGSLTITDTTATVLGSGFEIVAPLPGPIAPNACGDLIIQFTAPATIGAQSFDYTIGSNDGKAGNVAAHNQRTHLQATARQLEIAMVLDASGSMAFTPDGSSVPPAQSDTRWGKVTAAADQFLDLLEFFAGDRARIAMVLFPDITGAGYPPPVPDQSAKVIQSAIQVPADVTPLKNLLAPPNHAPQAGFGWTTMGRGIGTAMGTIPGSYGEFEGSPGVDLNRRWLVMMSDGAQNLGASGTPDHPNFYYGTGATSFKGKKIKVFAAAYGDEGAVNWPPDHAQMQTLRTQSDGIYSDAGTNDMGTDPGGDLGLNVFKSFRSAITSGLTLDPTTDPGGVLTSSNTEERYPVIVLPYDTQLSFVVNWGTFSSERVSVQLMTPNCELITPEIARHHPQLSYSGHPRYAIYNVREGYLSNSEEPSNPRYGTWTLIVQANGLEGADREAFEYEVITRSRLKMHLEFGRESYYTGDSISLSARLTLDGKPLTNANVTWRRSAPGLSPTNWLALNPVSAAEYQLAAKDFQGSDVTPLVIKSHALLLKGLKFSPFGIQDTATLTDPDGSGVYSASTGEVQVPGPYNFRVTAVGTTPDGLIFRREQQVQTFVTVRPDPVFTIYDTVYTSVLLDDQRFEVATVRVWPRDRFGNVVLVDPETNPLVELTARGADFTGPLVGNLDGSYTRALRYTPGTRPAIQLQVDGETVGDARPIQPTSGLSFVNQVVDYQPGREAEKGANQHTDPKVALGDVASRQEEQFVALGGVGSLTLGVEGQYILPQSDGEDFTVFVFQPDATLRPYRVEALGPDGRWVPTGTSTGVTQSFSLRNAGLRGARAIRLIDNSDVVLDAEFKPSHAPGTCILGLGYKQAGQVPGPIPSPDGKGCLAILIGLIDSLLGRRKA